MPLLEYLSALLLSISLLFLDLQKQLLHLPMMLLSQILKLQPRCRVKTIFPHLLCFLHFRLILHVRVCLGGCMRHPSRQDRSSGDSFRVKHPELMLVRSSSRTPYRELLLMMGGLGRGGWELHVVGGGEFTAGAARSILLRNNRHWVRRWAGNVHEYVLAWAGCWLSEKHISSAAFCFWVWFWCCVSWWN